MTLQQVFPGTSHSASGAIVAIADNILDLTGPGAQLTTALAEAHVNLLVSQIKRVDPNYRLETLGFPQTFAGQMNLIRHLRVERAVAFYRTRGELRPLQVETLRRLQDATDRAYDAGDALYRAGRLTVRLSREEAIGNYVDREVRKSLRDFFNRNQIPISANGPFRIIGREYISTGTDRTYRIPDARVGSIAFDVTLARKTHSTPPVRGFFASEFRPEAVIIVRPTQIGVGSTYHLQRTEK